ncbi:hypothetical protein ABBQ32_013569 [Trebouxia sp. C0010 RCD-2024]
MQLESVIQQTATSQTTMRSSVLQQTHSFVILSATDAMGMPRTAMMQVAGRKAAPHGCKADCRSCHKLKPNAAQLCRTVWYGVLQVFYFQSTSAAQVQRPVLMARCM